MDDLPPVEIEVEERRLGDEEVVSPASLPGMKRRLSEPLAVLRSKRNKTSDTNSDDEDNDDDDDDGDDDSDDVESTSKETPHDGKAEDGKEGGTTKEQRVFVSDLSDEVLLNILKYLDSASLSNFADTCDRFQCLCQDTYLWINVDFLELPMSARELSRRLRYVHEKTVILKVSGLRSLYPAKRSRNILLTPNILEKLRTKCPQLREFCVTDAMLNIDTYPITQFPGSLTSLTLYNCASPTLSRTFFNRIDDHMRELTELRIEYCNFFETNQLIALSKLPNLLKLSLRGCRSLKDCVPYGSVATRFGFQKLESLDIRDTPVSDSEIQCFNVVKTLRILKMEYPRSLSEQTECNHCVPSVSTSPASSTSSSSSTSTSPSSPSSLQPSSRHQNANAGADAGQRGVPLSVARMINVVVNGQHLVAAAPVDIPVPFAVEQQQQLIVVRNVLNNDNAGPAAGNAPAAGPPGQRVGWEVVVDDLELANQFGVFSRYVNRPTLPNISDRAICSFGMARLPHLVWIRAEQRMAQTMLEHLIVRGYKGITDISLRHMAECAPNLRHIDVTGTSVTAAGVAEFQLAKPDCVVMHGHTVERH